jgi:nucleotide-binding universal stress UspA family protein
MATIVCGYDGTDGGKVALEEAIGLASALGDDLVVVFAYKKVVIGGESHDLDEEVQERAELLLAEASELARARGVTPRTAYEEGTPAEVLVAVGDREDARFIVTGSHGEGPLRAALVGSTPYRLVHLSERPLLIVRHPSP